MDVRHRPDRSVSRRMIGGPVVTLDEGLQLLLVDEAAARQVLHDRPERLDRASRAPLQAGGDDIFLDRQPHLQVLDAFCQRLGQRGDRGRGARVSGIGAIGKGGLRSGHSEWSPAGRFAASSNLSDHRSRPITYDVADRRPCTVACIRRSALVKGVVAGIPGARAKLVEAGGSPAVRRLGATPGKAISRRRRPTCVRPVARSIAGRASAA